MPDVRSDEREGRARAIHRRLQWRVQNFGSGGKNLRNSDQSRQYFVTLKMEICESRTPTLGTLSMISLEVDFLNIYYNIFNNTAIIYIRILQYLTVHT